MRALTRAVVLMSTMVSASALAQPKKPVPQPVPKIEKAPVPTAVIGLEAKGAFAPERGFIDDVVTADAARLGIVVTDGAAQVEIQIISNQDAGEIARLDVAAVAPAVRRFYLLGDRVFVVGDADDHANVAAALIGLDGKVVKAHKVATDHHLLPYKGADTVV